MGVKKVFIAGGSSIFEEGSMYANEAHLTQVFVPKSVQFKSPIVVNKKAIDEMRSRLRRAELNYFEADANNQYPYAFENLLIGV
jgi:dihydrofolate reductase